MDSRFGVAGDRGGVVVLPAADSGVRAVGGLCLGRMRRKDDDKRSIAEGSLASGSIPVRLFDMHR
jgi:hypothetical protein